MCSTTKTTTRKFGFHALTLNMFKLEHFFEQISFYEYMSIHKRYSLYNENETNQKFGKISKKLKK